MADSARARRLAKRIVTIVATELEHQVKDPRLAMVTVTAATLTPDLRDAVVYYTVFGDADEQASTAAALASATGVLRTAVGRQTGVKFTPTLAFKPDTVPESRSRIEELLAAAKAADAAIAQQAAGAVYAGEADPYRVREEDTADRAGADHDDADHDDADHDDADHDDADHDDADRDDADEEGADPGGADGGAADDDADDDGADGDHAGRDGAERGDADRDAAAGEDVDQEAGAARGVARR